MVYLREIHGTAYHMKTAGIMDIGIAGCGIAGLAAGILLAQQGHDVTIFDQFTAPAPVGAGLILQPVGQAVLHRLGVGTAARELGAPLTRMVGHEAVRGRRALNVHYSTSDASRFGLGIHRAALFSLLHQAAVDAGVKIRSSSSVSASPLQADKRSLQLADGSADTSGGVFDLVIDATGANSTLTPMKRQALAFGAIWGCVDWPAHTPLPYDVLAQKYRHSAVMLGILPIGTLQHSAVRKAAVFWSLTGAGFLEWQRTPLEAWKTQLCELWPEVQPFLDGIQSHAHMTMARYSHGTLQRPYAERLAFIGDSAHCASPQLGQGANMALLDAFALAEALARLPVSEALPTYARARRNHVWLYQLISKLFTPLYQSNNKLPAFLRDWLLVPATAIPPLPGILGKLVSGDLVAPVRGRSLKLNERTR